MNSSLTLCSASAGNSRSSRPDRKSTRLNSSHSQISYAVFCLKKKKFPLPPFRTIGIALILTPLSIVVQWGIQLNIDHVGGTVVFWRVLAACLCSVCLGRHSLD